MARLIDADALVKALNESGVPYRADVQDVLDAQPTIDAVPVVWCKDCRWWTKQEKSIQGRCALTGTYPTGGWYCGNGERKDDDTD